MGGKIIVAYAALPERKVIVDMLRTAGHQVVAETSEIAGTLRKVRSLFCDLVIVDGALEGGKGAKAATIITEDNLAAVMLLVDNDVFPQARQFHYLVKPISYSTIIPAAEAALLYWQRQQELENRIRELESKLQTRRLLDKAKGILMDKKGISENEAHRFIQKKAMDNGSTLMQVAVEIINQLSPKE